MQLPSWLLQKVLCHVSFIHRVVFTSCVCKRMCQPLPIHSTARGDQGGTSYYTTIVQKTFEINDKHRDSYGEQVIHSHNDATGKAVLSLKDKHEVMGIIRACMERHSIEYTQCVCVCTHIIDTSCDLCTGHARSGLTQHMAGRWGGTSDNTNNKQFVFLVSTTQLLCMISNTELVLDLSFPPQVVIETTCRLVEVQQAQCQSSSQTFVISVISYIQ